MLSISDKPRILSLCQELGCGYPGSKSINNNRTSCSSSDTIFSKIIKGMKEIYRICYEFTVEIKFF